MSYDSIIVERHDAGVATLTLNRPEQLNTLSMHMRQEMAQAIVALQRDAVSVLILTAKGRAFTAGLDLDEWRADGTSDGTSHGASDGPSDAPIAAGAYLFDPVAALQSFEGVVIGAINGLAITGGLEIALACDVLIASSSARFADTHALVGLLPGWGGSVRLVRRVGLLRAKEMALTGRVLTAADALAWGLVNQVVPPDQLLAAAEAMAQQMLAAVPGTLKDYKRLLDEVAALPMDAALRHERAASVACNASVERSVLLERLAALRQRQRASEG